tara:strand:- start:1290 stop:1997 length:708 start_codon:yes stop_codon:yes gene_type:complete
MAGRTFPHGPHRNVFRENVQEVARLLEIHSEVSGSNRGRRHNLEVLNKSAIVLLVATWESYVEELAINSFDFLIKNSAKPEDIPRRVRVLSSKNLKNSKNELDVWALADSGWVEVLKQHQESTIKKYVKTLNTPRTSNIDEIFESLLDLKNLSDNWYWKGMSKVNSHQKLEQLITLRGEIAHTVKASNSVTKSNILEYKEFLSRLATISHNKCNRHLLDICGKQAWRTYKHGQTR